MFQYAFLYIEDDPFSRDVMRILLQELMGVPDLFMFEDSAHFIERLRQLPVKPDCVFLDIHVRPVDGFSLLKLLRADPQYRSTKIVALTASVMNEEIEKLRAAGFDGAISKPLNIRTFPTLVNRILANQPVWYIM